MHHPYYFGRPRTTGTINSPTLTEVLPSSSEALLPPPALLETLMRLLLRGAGRTMALRGRWDMFPGDCGGEAESMLGTAPQGPARKGRERLGATRRQGPALRGRNPVSCKGQTNGAWLTNETRAGHSEPPPETQTESRLARWLVARRGLRYIRKIWGIIPRGRQQIIRDGR